MSASAGVLSGKGGSPTRLSLRLAGTKESVRGRTGLPPGHSSAAPLHRGIPAPPLSMAPPPPAPFKAEIRAGAAAKCSAGAAGPGSVICAQPPGNGTRQEGQRQTGEETSGRNKEATRS
ncbi:hypothetical protein NDU88_004172 [Pleurodeles waltl]|uniref:Uncharacterized protein n=1 Tax=Pleurodeles waltl TaxID=8319 RepID=A0AAV7VJ64_PLEWA|nr:hypothetical protein NDU88_004172 [Pleurodeles waltl]